MRTWLKFGIAIAATAMWALAPPSAGAQSIVGSDHDFSGRGASSVCISCHAPHHVPNTPLLWNHTFSAQNFSWSDMTQTTGGTPLPTNIKTWSGSSKMCLSCHDGTVGVGTLYTSSYTYTGSSAPVLTGAGGDLKGNHPVAVPYPNNSAKNTYNGATTGNNLLLTEYKINPARVKLFNDASVLTSNNWGIECASCHNPHNNVNGDFLRDTRAVLCQNCHTK